MLPWQRQNVVHFLLEVYRAWQNSIHIGSNIFYTPGLYCSSVKPLTVLERTLKQDLSSNYKTFQSSFLRLIEYNVCAFFCQVLDFSFMRKSQFLENSRYFSI